MLFEFMPHAQLATKDVDSRWHQAAHLQAGAELPDSSDTSHMMSFASTRQLKTASSSQRSRVVMFTDAHLHELVPADWNTEEHVLGKGSYGIVFKATWRGKPVAVKQVLLPEEPASARKRTTRNKPAVKSSAKTNKRRRL